jgi:acetyltransferase-like isoleucine patch superfamily enzyme
MLPSMFVDYRPLLKSCGEGVRINDLVKMVQPEVIEIGAGTRLCDSVFLLGGNGLKIGQKCDLQPGVVVWGGGSCEIGDRVSVGANTVILTGEYEMGTAEAPLFMVDFEEPHQATYAGVSVPPTRIDSDAYIGCNVSIRRGIHVGQGAVIGMGGVVNRDIPPWEIWVGNPARKIKDRPRIPCLCADPEHSPFGGVLPGEDTLS